MAVVLVSLGIGMPTDETARRRLVLEATITAAAVGIGCASLVPTSAWCRSASR